MLSISIFQARLHYKDSLPVGYNIKSVSDRSYSYSPLTKYYLGHQLN